MSPEHFFQRIREDLAPEKGAKNRIQKRIEQRVGLPRVFAETKKALTPGANLQQGVWGRVVRGIGDMPSGALLERLREILTPTTELAREIRHRLAPRLAPVSVTRRAEVALKWTASFALLLLLIQVGPQIFLAPHTVAESAVTLLPTRGEVAISAGGLWQPVTEEIRLEPGTLLRTHDGEASIIFHDDGVIRLDERTTVRLDDTSDRATMSDSLVPTFSLITGRVWVQGLVPAQFHGINVEVENGIVSVHEGSVSIVENEEEVDVRVLHRGVRIFAGGQDVYMVAGERTSLSEGSPMLVKKFSEDEYEHAWAAQNLQRDAVHRRSIAQLQQERRAARAGILPTSPLYSVKRIAETVDVLLTFGENAKTQKRLDHANGRLNEAAALLSEGEVEAVRNSLEDYRDSLFALAASSGDTLVQFLIQQSLAEATAGVSAALPDDDGYLLKQAVLEASAGMPEGGVSIADVHGVLLVDTVTALLRKVDEGGVEDIEEIWADLQQHMAVLDDEQSDLRPEVRKEAKVLLSELAFAVMDLQGQEENIDPNLLEQVATYLPPESETVSVLSEEEIMAIVQGIKDRIFVYRMPRSRTNQLVVEFRALEGHPDQGRILRRLYFALPEGPEELPERVRKEIIRLQWQKAGEEG